MRGVVRFEGDVKSWPPPVDEGRDMRHLAERLAGVEAQPQEANAKLDRVLAALTAN